MFAIPLLIVATIGFFSFQSARSYLVSSSWEKHTYQVIDEIALLARSLRTAESEQRGFVITGEQSYLDRYYESVDFVGEKLDSLQQLTSDSAQEQQRIAELRSLVAQRVIEMEGTIALRRNLALEQVASEIAKGEGERGMVEISHLLAEMETEEQKLLTERRDRANFDAYHAQEITAALAVVITVLLVGGFLRLRQDSRQRLLAENRLAAQYRFASILGDADDLEPAIARLLSMICSSLHWDVGEIWMRERTSDKFVLFDFYGPAPKSKMRPSSEAVKIRRGEGLPGRVWETGRAMWIQDVQTDPEFLRHFGAVSDRVHSATGFPIVAEGTVIGVLAFYCHGVRNLDEETLDMLGGFGRQLGQYVERKIAEQQLTEERNFQRMTLSSIGDGVVTSDTAGAITYMNSVAEQLTGWKLEEARGRKSIEVMHMESEREEEAVADQVRAVLESGTSYDLEERTLLVHRDGRRIPVADSAAPIRDEDGKTTGVVMIFRDVSARRELERMKDEFISIVSHELRTPLTSIRGSLGLLEAGVAGELPPKVQRMLTIAVSNTDRLIRLINDILDIERMESGKVQLEKAECRIHEVMRQAVEAVHGMASQNEVEILLKPINAIVWADQDRILQIMTNLLGNAVKFSTSGGTVTLEGEANAARVLLKVVDTGRGIPADRLDSIFGKFQQVDASDSRQKGGTGLGLAISRTLARQHGGDIWVESELGKGSTFYLSLPIGDVAVAAAVPAAQLNLQN